MTSPGMPRDVGFPDVESFYRALWREWVHVTRGDRPDGAPPERGGLRACRGAETRAVNGFGTRFRLFAQDPALTAFREPETVWIARPRGDDRARSHGRAHVRHRRDRQARPYEYPYLPPYVGPRLPSRHARSGWALRSSGNGSPAFRAAHMYATVRRVLDIWEGYAGPPDRVAFPRGPRSTRARALRRLGERPGRVRLHRDRVRGATSAASRTSTG